MRHYYIRHAEHTGDALTATGVEEARSLHERLFETEPGLGFDSETTSELNSKRIKAWSADTFRSLATTALALRPATKYEDLSSNIQSLMRSGILHADPALRYTKFTEHDSKIRDAYQAAYEKGRTMDFYIRRSDEFLRLNPALSTHSTLAVELARRTLSAQSENTPRLLCAREFFWPNFRTALLNIQNKTNERDQYVEWYCEEKELNPLARTDIARVFSESSHIVLEDDYGTLACTEYDLLNVVKKGITSV